MALTFVPVMLHSSVGDHEGMLVKQDDELIAILSHLGSLHGDAEGRWFVEYSFLDDGLPAGATFQELGALELHMLAGS